MKNKILFCLFILFVLFFLLGFSAVEGSEITDNLIINYCDRVKNDNGYTYDYKVYSDGGFVYGSFNLPDNMADGIAHIITYDSSGSLIYISGLTDSSCEMWACYVGSYTCFQAFSGDIKGVRVSTYNKDTKTWSDFVTYSNFDFSINRFLHPNSVLTVNGISLYYVTKKEPVDTVFGEFHKEHYTKLKDNQSFNYPIFEYIENTGIRVHISSDFYGFSFNNTYSSTVGKFSNIFYSQYNTASSTMFPGFTSVFNDIDVKQSDSGSYYFDLNFGDILPLAYKRVSGTYRIKFYIDNTVTYHRNDFEKFGSPYTDLQTLYRIPYYFTITYDSNSNTGTMVPTDSEGDPITPITPPSTPEPSATPDPMQEAIGEQTNSIKENTEVQKNIFQQIIELPR